MTEVKQMTQREGEAVVAYLRQMPESGWNTTTVCSPWTVADLVGHLTGLGNQTLGNFAGGFIRSGFNFEKTVNRDMQQYLTGTHADRIDRLAEAVANPSTPKQLSEIALGEFICHGEDIRRALGDRGEHSGEHIAIVGPLQAKSKGPIQGKKRTEGLSFAATDSDWKYGSGPEVRGPGIDLICAITGRPYGLDTLEGPGLATLRARL